MTLRDVAKAAGVSKSTVSRAFNELGSCRSKTRKRILKLADKMGYRPSRLASALTTKQTKLIGLLVNNFENPFIAEILGRFTSELQSHEHGCLIVSIDDGMMPETAAEMLLRYDVDGVFVASSTLPDNFVNAIQNRGIPIVHAFGRDAPERATSVVGIDNVKCGVIAAEALLNAGYRNVAFLGGPKLATTTIDRELGFTQRAKELGLSIIRSANAEAYTYAAGLTTMGALMNGNRSFDAVFCGDDLLCIAAMDVARSFGINVPDDMGFVGVNNMSLSSWDNYAITTVQQPLQAVVDSSVELMLHLLSAGQQSKHVRMLDCELIKRRTLK